MVLFYVTDQGHRVFCGYCALSQFAFQARSSFHLMACRWSQESFEFGLFDTRRVHFAVALFLQCACALNAGRGALNREHATSNNPQPTTCDLCPFVFICVHLRSSAVELGKVI